jgi:CheY-like chemotaxis protein
LPDLPVILCSGYSIGISAENAADHQVDHYLDKPVNADALLQAMHACLENAR